MWSGQCPGGPPVPRPLMTHAGTRIAYREFGFIRDLIDFMCAQRSAFTVISVTPDVLICRQAVSQMSTLNRLHSISISYFVCFLSYINHFPMIFHDVKVYQGDPWYEPAREMGLGLEANFRLNHPQLFQRNGRYGRYGSRSRQWPLFLLLFCEDVSETDFVGRMEKGSSNMEKKFSH